MGFRLYRSVSLGQGARIYLTKTGVGVSAGLPGLRYSVHSSGRRTSTVGVPGTGLSYRDTHGPSRAAAPGRRPIPVPPVVAMPKVRLFASRDEKAFVRGLTAYMRGDHQGALLEFQDSMARDTAEAHVAEEYFASFCLVASDRTGEAIDLLRKVIASPTEVPDALMQRYHVGGEAQIMVTPEIRVHLPHSSLAAALLLAELLQHSSKPDEAAQLLETIGSVAPYPSVALSLADLYTDLGRWDDVVRVTDGFTVNADDLTCQMLRYRAHALRSKGLNDGAMAMLKETLKSKRRDPVLLRQARYERGLTYEAMGKAAYSRRDFEQVYAEDPSFADVASRVDAFPRAAR